VTELVPDVVKRGYLLSTAPLVRALLRSRVSPNALTTAGAALILAASVAFGFGQIRLGGLLLLLSGLLDTLDGQVARQGAQTSAFGAFYDSTLDRIGDGTTLIGIAAFLLSAPDVRWRNAMVLCCMAGILAALLVSYMRARAEGLGLECKVGIVQRAERIIGLGLPTLIFGAGSGALVLSGMVVLLTILSFITVGQRFAHVYRATAQVGAS
jgi:CDP-diacylglycerol--glycerol-3-phosphate 3-phosphatidyltransferase